MGYGLGKSPGGRTDFRALVYEHFDRTNSHSQIVFQFVYDIFIIKIPSHPSLLAVFVTPQRCLPD
jgi:hypothetical protein